jgi:hypothetical protein
MLNYQRHFLWLTCLAVPLAVASPLYSTLGPVSTGGIYAALHSSALVMTLRTAPPARRMWLFVACAVGLGMLAVGLSLALNRLGEWPAVRRPAVLLGLSAGFGAAAYALLLRGCLGFGVRGTTVISIVSACVAATLMVFAAGIYRRGLFWFAVFWWLAFSLALWYHDVRRTSALA